MQASEVGAYSAMLGRPVEAGAFVRMPACATPCPRVDLLPDNEPAAEVMRLSLTEHTRHLMAVPEVVGLIGEGLEPRERGLLIVRAGRALQDRRIVDRLYPKMERDDG